MFPFLRTDICHIVFVVAVPSASPQPLGMM
jgi:hypothetical protein